VYLQGEYQLVSPCHYLDVRIKQMGSSSPLQLRSEQPQSTQHPPPLGLQRRDQRGPADTELPHSSLHAQYLWLPQRVDRGEASAAHRHPQPDDLGLMMRTLPPPYSCCHATPHRTPRNATVYSASRGGPPSLAV
jgi:hypothetical protein